MGRKSRYHCMIGSSWFLYFYMLCERKLRYVRESTRKPFLHELFLEQTFLESVENYWMLTFCFCLCISLCSFLIHGGEVNVWLGSLLLQTLCCEESSACEWENRCTHSEVWWLCLLFYSWVCWGLLMTMFCIDYFIVECVEVCYWRHLKQYIYNVCVQEYFR